MSHSNISSLRDITMGSGMTYEHPATQAKPLYPDLCLEYIWTESNTQTPKRCDTINRDSVLLYNLSYSIWLIFIIVLINCFYL